MRAAVAARQSPDFLIIARTDSRAVLGFEEAIKRDNAALHAGADMAFVEAPQTLEEVSAVPCLVSGPCLLNVVWRGKTPDIAFADAATSSPSCRDCCSRPSSASAMRCDAMLTELKTRGQHPVIDTQMTVRDAFRRVGADDWDAVSERLRATGPPTSKRSEAAE